MEKYQTRVNRFRGTDYHEVVKRAHALYKQIKRRSKRRPYIRARYFKKQKIFLELFWTHLYEKENFRDKIRRLQYLPCAIELIEDSMRNPSSKQNPNNYSEILHRFLGETPMKELFYVQIKENKRTNQKYLMSVFPVSTKKKAFR